MVHSIVRVLVTLMHDPFRPCTLLLPHCVREQASLARLGTLQQGSVLAPALGVLPPSQELLQSKCEFLLFLGLSPDPTNSPSLRCSFSEARSYLCFGFRHTLHICLFNGFKVFQNLGVCLAGSFGFWPRNINHHWNKEAEVFGYLLEMGKEKNIRWRIILKRCSVGVMLIQKAKMGPRDSLTEKWFWDESSGT